MSQPNTSGCVDRALYTTLLSWLTQNASRSLNGHRLRILEAFQATGKVAETCTLSYEQFVEYCGTLEKNDERTQIAVGTFRKECSKLSICLLQPACHVLKVPDNYACAVAIDKTETNPTMRLDLASYRKDFQAALRLVKTPSNHAREWLREVSVLLDMPRSKRTLPASPQSEHRVALPRPLAATPSCLEDNVCSFGAYPEERARDFTGRRFVFEAIDAFLTDSSTPSGYFMIYGDPGIGKSAIAARLLLYPSELKTDALHLVVHFNIALQRINTPRDFIANVCSQLITQHALPHTALPEGFHEGGAFLAKVLNETAEKLEPRHKLVVVVDALDEVDQPNRSMVTNPLYLPVALPGRVYFIVTSRRKDPAKVALRAHNVKALDLEAAGPMNMKDVADFIQGWTGRDGVRKWMSKERLAEEEFVKIIADSSMGNFMYLFHVLRAVEKGEFRLEGADRIPQGLRECYRYHWAQMQQRAGANFERMDCPVICVLAAEPDPVPLDQVARSTGLETAEVARVMRDWAEFLHSQPQPNGKCRYSLYHTAFREFLGEEIDFGLKRHHALIARSRLAEVRKRKAQGK